MGLKVMDGDEAFYYLHKGGQLQGAVITHVDDFNLAGTDKFVAKVIKEVEEQLTVSKIEKDKFRFTGLDVSTVGDTVQISMEDYASSFQGIPRIRKADRDEELSDLEMKEYRKVTGKLSWLANNTRPDLSFIALRMSKKNTSATIADLQDIERVLKKVRERESFIQFSRIGHKDDLIVVGI